MTGDARIVAMIDDVTTWHPLSRGMIEKFGPRKVWLACMEVLGYPVQLMDSTSEIRKIRERLNVETR